MQTLVQKSQDLSDQWKNPWKFNWEGPVAQAGEGAIYGIYYYEITGKKVFLYVGSTKNIVTKRAKFHWAPSNLDIYPKASIYKVMAFLFDTGVPMYACLLKAAPLTHLRVVEGKEIETKRAEGHPLLQLRIGSKPSPLETHKPKTKAPHTKRTGRPGNRTDTKVVSFRKFDCNLDSMVNIYDSLREAAEDVGGYANDLSRVMLYLTPQGKPKTHAGYYWRYVEFGLNHKTITQPTLPLGQKVVAPSKARDNGYRVTCLTTGKTYSSAAEAARDVGGKSGSIGLACKGKIKTSGKLPSGERLSWAYTSDLIKAKAKPALPPWRPNYEHQQLPNSSI